MEALSTISDLIIGTGTLIISVYLLVSELRIRRVSSHELVVKAYDSLNILGLESGENLRALAEVLYPEKRDNLEILRERLFAYLALNAIELTFLSSKHKIIRRDEADPIMDDLLKSVLQNREAQDIIEKGTYDERFTKLARKTMNTLRRNETESPVEPSSTSNQKIA